MPEPLPPRDLLGHPLPALLYGTAWKEEATADLVRQAVRAGFRGIDTANQRKHYHEAGVGAALRTLYEAGEVTRDDLFLQTKFTFLPGQDHRLPYDPGAPVSEQVAQSFRSSLEHLGTEWLDSYVLHGPSRRSGLGEADREAWRAMEGLHAQRGVRFLGVSNVTLEQLRAFVDLARVPPRIVQNRCFARSGWDAAVRSFCAAHGIVYQGFSLLTANPHVLAHPALRAIAASHGATPPQVVFRFALQVGMQPLTGTTSATHMGQDLGVGAFTLGEDEVTRILSLGT